VSIRLISKTFKNLSDPKLLNSNVYFWFLVQTT